MGDIRTGQAVDYNSLATVLCQRAQGSDDAIQLICMRWLRELVAVAKPQLKEQYADILAAVLPSLSHGRPDIASVGTSALAWFPITAIKSCHIGLVWVCLLV